jgi:hypothetical protein
MKAYFIFFLTISTVFSPVSDPYQVSTTLSKDQVWMKLTQFFAYNGISIKTVDKNSGLIQSDKIGFGSYCNLEGNEDSTAWALCNRIPEINTPYFHYPQVMNGELMVLVQEIGGKTQINIHFFNLNAYELTENGEYHFTTRSTHVLEKRIGQYLVESTDETLKIKIDPAHALFGEPKAQADLRAAKAKAQADWNDAEEKKAKMIEEDKTKASSLLLILAIVCGAIFGILNKDEQ